MPEKVTQGADTGSAEAPIVFHAFISATSCCSLILVLVKGKWFTHLVSDMMNLDFVLLGLGVLLTLILGLVFTVGHCFAPFSLSRTLVQLLIFIPFFLSTLRMLVLHKDMLPDFDPTGTVTASRPADPGQESDGDYESINDDVTTVHNL